jgi:hypothetical protein
MLDDATVAVVFRHPLLNDTKSKKVVQFAREQQGKKLNTEEIARQLLCYKRGVLCSYPSKGETWSCSELVLGAYQQAGLTVILTTASGKAPGELARNSVLNYVGHLRAP